MKQIYNLLICIIFIGIMSCKTTQKMKNEIPKIINTEQITSDGNLIVSGQIIKKKFVMKNGSTVDFYEFYFRSSKQDYFIKFCESKISSIQLLNHIGEVDNKVLNQDEIKIEKTVRLEIKIIYGGLLDVCNDYKDMQSRMGDYIIINKIVED